jgi:hypothetical protein
MPSESCCAGRWATVAFFFFDANFAPALVSVASSLYVASILCSMTISDLFFSPTSSCRTLLLPLHRAVVVEMIHPRSFARLNPWKPLLSRPTGCLIFTSLPLIVVYHLGISVFPLCKVNTSTYEDTPCSLRLPLSPYLPASLHISMYFLGIQGRGYTRKQCYSEAGSRQP